MLKIILTIGLLSLFLSGCATHDPNQVRIEDRSLEGQADSSIGSSSQTTRGSSVEAITPVTPELTQPEANKPVRAPQSSVNSVAEPSAPSYQPPATRVAPTEPSGALLALLEQAEQQHQAGRNQQALSSLERAQRISPRDPLVYLQLARLRLDMKDYPRAEQLARKGLNLSAGNSQMQKAFRALLQRIKGKA